MTDSTNNPEQAHSEATPTPPVTKGTEPTNPFLTTGSHIGTVYKTGDMRRYIFKRRKDGLLVLNVENIEERLKIAAAFLSRFPPQKVVIVARRLYPQTGAKKLAELTGFQTMTGRFIPGTFSNPQHKKFTEPAAILVSEPEADLQAIKEASVARIPVVAFVSTNNSLRNVDLAIPMNNKGRKSLALAFWTLAKEIQLTTGQLKHEADFKFEIDDFEYKLPPSQGGEEDPVKQAIMEGREMRKSRFGRRNRPRTPGDYKPGFGRKSAESD